MPDLAKAAADAVTKHLSGNIMEECARLRRERDALLDGACGLSEGAWQEFWRNVEGSGNVSVARVLELKRRCEQG